ncbi:MAG: 50S ribosomal protein L6 [Gammaproteobacteria bacterium]|nr:50S ribosomal protein L6 [Gammaproteobacteria bacterium]MYB39653.1 50S ribosomal protein L6 [Gammaproteobacteria bacterium]
MSRVANSPVSVPSGVEVQLGTDSITVKGSKGALSMPLPGRVNVAREGEEIRFAPAAGDRQSRALAGTVRSLVNNMVTGVTEGFEKRLELQGVGYRAQAQGKRLNLQLGFSHPIDYQPPDGVAITTPSQTEVVVSGVDKQLVGQVSAEIRAFRPPEPYKGKGVRYVGERVRRKEGKKK